MSKKVTGTGTADDPWVLQTPPGTSEFQMHRDDTADPAELVCQVGTTKLRYLARCLDDVPEMLSSAATGWISAAPTRTSRPRTGTLEEWARSPSNPVKGWYGLRKGYRGRFAMYMPPLLEHSAWSSSSTTRRTTGCAPSADRDAPDEHPLHRAESREI